MTDSNSDIPYYDLETLDIEMLYMPYYIDGECKVHDMGKGNCTEEFFQAMREGKETTTSLLTPLQYTEAFEPILAAGNDILFICMSSALSSTFGNAHFAAKELLEKYPGRRLEIIDSRGMSIGMAQATEYCVQLRDEGKSVDQIRTQVEDLLLRQQYCVTVSDLKYLRKSGRLTGASAVVGTMLDIKPIIKFDYEGRLVPTEKVKGRKNALRTIAKRIAEKIINPQDQVLRIAQADCLEDAELMRSYLLEQMPELKGVQISFLGPVIAAHVGPGSMGVLWHGEKRVPTPQ